MQKQPEHLQTMVEEARGWAQEILELSGLLDAQKSPAP